MEKEAQVALTRLIDIQKAIYQQPLDAELHNQDVMARKEYDRLTTTRLSVLKQKVKNACIKGGDENSAYFHACLRKRRQQNHVYNIKDNSGARLENPSDVEAAFLRYLW